MHFIGGREECEMNGEEVGEVGEISKVGFFEVALVYRARALVIWHMALID